MPPEPTKAKSKRKSSRREAEESYRFDGGHAREIEQKRNSGQISCAECRRLKIKCDKQIPCQSCQASSSRRGCAALCPNGSLATGQGTRFVLAATEHLHRRIAKMSERIRQLEDALGVLQSQHSTEPHPLLRDDLLGVNQRDDDGSGEMDDGAGPSNPPEVLDAFGTLSITDHGISRFFGPTGGSEVSVMSDKSASVSDHPTCVTPDSTRSSKSPGLPQELTMFSQAFPFTPMGPVATVRELIEGHLPKFERANYLAETYLTQAAWLFRGVARDQIVDELLPIYYRRGHTGPADEHKSAHDLALLFLIFAIGALVDLAQEPSNPEAEHYHQIARAAICLQPVLEKPSLVTIQALHLLSVYNAVSGNELSAKETSMETTWSLIILAAHLSQTVHRDSLRWGLPAKVVQRRRILFWDLFVADAWHSLNTGRPPTFSLAYVDCRFPDGAAVQSEDGDRQEKSEFESWGFRFASECVAEVAVRTLTAEAPSYATIMELDRKVREFPIPEPAAVIATTAATSTPVKFKEDSLSLSESMGLFAMSNSREVSDFFAQAIMENPVNPLKSSYAPSFLAAYRASSTILRTIQAQYLTHPNLSTRIWAIWTFAFSAAIVFGTIVTRGPRSPLASNAMKELDDACILFSKVAAFSRRAAKALPILTRLREKAHAALSAALNDQPSVQLGQYWSVKEEENDDELAIFAGRTRFVSTKRPQDTATDVSETSRPPSISPYCPPPLCRSEQSVSPIYRPEPPQIAPTTSTWPQEQPRHYHQQQSESHASIGPSQWRPSQKAHYPYTPQDHMHPPPPHHGHSQDHGPAAGPSVPSWTAPPNNHYRSSHSQYLGTDTHTHYHLQTQHYTPSLTPIFPPSRRSQPSPPSELAELGLVSQDSRLDERWTSFMRESGYFDEYGYRNR
ncbi:fungal-specific transcription factor domain-containing protein [Hygrophoropsis aurantiaca]|uniref:Fungal-specific transcription factor domain-containing protein n=1 Tax=Hygrophoropsis aurantiaca TaxID=72124 RepID=A0ACB8AA55_9AGAM|nr:fungal-specific transcription factor domain-containing protein [Hygrophoropsis aurantiaca]